MCRPRKGAGIKNLQSFDLASLGKWRWRMLIEGCGLWRKVIGVRCGGAASRGKILGSSEVVSEGSIWWRDLWRLEDRESTREGWLSGTLKSILGNEREVIFWKEDWLGSGFLGNIFNMLHHVFPLKEGLVADIGAWNKGCGVGI